MEDETTGKMISVEQPIVLLVATYKTTKYALLLHLLVVQTNVNCQLG